MTILDMEPSCLIEKLKNYGIGRRKLDDHLFSKDKPPPRLGVFDVDDEDLCHEIVKSTCNVPGCTFTCESLLQFENHYNTAHRYSCSQCKKVLPSPHFLDLHIQEAHDSFFAVLSERKPSYCCYIQECKEKFKDAAERLQHCVKEHKLPKDFRYDFRTKPKRNKVKNSKIKNAMETEQSDVPDITMDVDYKPKPFSFTNSKQKAFSKYTGRKFTNNEKKESSKEVKIMEIVKDLKESLP